VKTALALAANSDAPADWPEAASLAALRAWYEGMSTREVVSQYLAEKRAAGQSSRSMIGSIKRRLVAIAIERGRRDLAQVLEVTRPGKAKSARLASAAIEMLRTARAPMPLIGDDIDRWLAPRLAKVLRTAGIRTLADLTLRVPRRRRWWTAIPGLGVASARQVEAFFARHPELTERARALTLSTRVQELVPWERLVVPEVLDGSMGTHRAPRASCALSATNDYEAVNAWLSLHEAAATQRAYRKEAERLILWAIVERGKPLSSLSTEDAIAYRAFLRRPTPRERWIGVPCPRSSPEWRPFAGALSARSAAYALSVLGAMFRWLIEQRYVLANPFAGVKVRGTRPAALDTGRVFSEGEWHLLRTVADGLEWSYGWAPVAAQRLRFVLDFGYATGLRASELVAARLGDISTDGRDDHWISVVGKGAKTGTVVLPPLARQSLDRYLMQRGLPVTRSKWQPGTPLVGSLAEEAGITATRLWSVIKRFFAQAAAAVEAGSPSTAEKLLRATPHWMRHTHATHALDAGADLTTVRDNLRHSSISTTSVYLHADDARRAKQIAGAFAVRVS
jgi:site-specific recombinase XerD